MIYTSHSCKFDNQTHLAVPSLLRHWKRLHSGMEQSAEALAGLSERFKCNIGKWLESERRAQLKRSKDCTAMDIYDTIITRRMGIYYEPICVWLIYLFSSYTCRGSSDAYFRRGRRFRHARANNLDCVRYQDPGAAVSTYAHLT